MYGYFPAFVSVYHLRFNDWQSSEEGTGCLKTGVSISCESNRFWLIHSLFFRRAASDLNSSTTSSALRFLTYNG